MVETDWREVLSFSQRELGKDEKEQLCEGLSWMEVDDIELNFSDLKTLFRLAQDILKYKSEQVNSLLGQLETLKRAGGKKRAKKNQHLESPTSTESVLDTITHQDELIKANKEILEQLYKDIAELEERRSKLERDGNNVDDSDSSRDALSELNALAQLENEVAMKNRHIRKLLADVKILEEENTKFKAKTNVLKDKLTEATHLIDSLTEQLLQMSNEGAQLKHTLGKSEQAKAELFCEIEALRKQLFEKESTREIFDEIKSKVHHWKNIARKKKSEMEALSIENKKLKDHLTRVSKGPSPSEMKSFAEDQTLKELQDKLTEASKEIDQSANLIILLRAENRQIKDLLEETQDHSTIENRNESDEGKERILINKLKKKVKSLTNSLQEAEEMIAIREREIAEIATELQLVQSDDGINALIGGLKHKKRELRIKDEGIKSLIQEINNLSLQVNNLQIENEALRQKFNVPASETVETFGVIKKIRGLEHSNSDMCKEITKLENKLVDVEHQNHCLNKTNKKITRLLHSSGYNKYNIEDILQESEIDDCYSPKEGEASKTTLEPKQKEAYSEKPISVDEAEIKAIMAENEGLRKCLQEILDFLKDNSTTSSGILALECPSLEALLRSMEARHVAGWFSPHMSTILELRAAIGGKDALLKALHEARKETFDVMSQLSKEAKKSSDLERKLQDLETKSKKENNDIDENTTKFGEFGSWMADGDLNNIELGNENQIEQLVTTSNSIYEDQLRKGLEYFHQKFKLLYNKINTMAVQAADDQNKWSLQEEQYIAQIENLKGKVQQQEDEDISESSPGLISLPNPIYLQRKCIYLEESYKYIRTLNENIKNENMEAKKEMMSLAFEYETEIQRLVLAITNLTDKLRSSIPIEIFWKQNNLLNENIMKYRKIIENHVKNETGSVELFNRLENDKVQLVERFQRELKRDDKNENTPTGNIISSIEETVFKKQIHELCTELNNKEKQIDCLEKEISQLHENQSKIIDSSLASLTKQDIDLMKVQLKALEEENRLLKEKSKNVSNQLDIALLQLQDIQQCQMSNEMEINILRHQVLDLQSTSDNKAIVARMSGEVLVAHLQVTESNKKIDRLNSALNKEKELRAEAEDMLKARQKIFDVYSFRYESKFRYMFEIMQVLRHQYQGGIPLTVIENFLNNIEDVNRRSQVLNAKLQEIEDLRSNLMTKHVVLDQILDVSRNKCIVEGNSCPHKIKSTMMKSTQVLEIDHLKKKLKILEKSRDEVVKQYNHLEKTMVLLTQGLEKPNINRVIDRRHSDGEISISNLEVEDVHSDDDSSSRKSKTVTLPVPQVLKPLPEKTATINVISKIDLNVTSPTDSITMPNKIENSGKIPIFCNALVQTVSNECKTQEIAVQTIQDKSIIELKQKAISYNEIVERQKKELSEALSLVQQRTKENLILSTEKMNLETNIHTLKSNIIDKERLNEMLQFSITELRSELDNLRALQITERNQKRDSTSNENKSLLLALKQLEIDKNSIAAEYKELLNNEREEYAKTLKDLNVKNMELHSKLDRKASDSNGINNEALKDIVSKYTMKIVELEDKCFKLQSELDECKTELTTYQSEVDRWKDLAAERLIKMEQLNVQFGERHYQEVESYKAENQHWLTQLNDTQREHMELRSRLTKQKAMYIKQLSEKDGQIEHMRSVNNNLKTQVMNMQTMISVNDPSFDLSAIVEVDEASDATSHQGSDRLEIKFDCSGDLNETHDDFGRIGNSSTTIWHEPVIERLRRDKQLVGKQNAILRRQIKALASRERRSRLDAQNLRNQVFRISTSGSRVATAETAALHNKIASLQAQLTSVRRDATSSIALWDKWKRAQQAADRWQARFEEKCQEVKKLEYALNLSKSAVHRLDREKRMLISRMNQEKTENQLSIEKQENEETEKEQRSVGECSTCMNAPPLSNHTLLERIQAQQRRIAALEVAEKGNELLVSEYEKALAENTSLKGQVLKLESTLLESQIRSPLNENKDARPELDYWKNYCEMLKDENVQLNIRVNALESVPVTAHQHRISDLEQTILTLRGLVSKLQSEQKSGTVHRKVDSRPSSGKSGSTEKTRSQLESYRMEITNLKRSIQEKDLLLERSKEMLKIAAEREDDLLRENAFLRRQLEDITNPKQGFSSA